MPVPDLVLPGHPRNDSNPQSPCLTQKRWERLLDDGISEMETLQARYDRDGATFLDGSAHELLPGFYYLGDFKGMAVYGLATTTRFFLVDAPGGAGFTDFLDTRLKQLGVKPAPITVLLTSCEPGATAGLKELLASRNAQVVATAEGLERLAQICPPGTDILSAQELPTRGGLTARPIPLKGRGLAPVAYQVQWGKKTLLFSGQIPVPVSSAAVRGLRAELSGTGSSANYLASLKALRALNPDLWLPSQPVDCQNPHLYDREWQDIIEYNWNEVW
jgi:hypothetical protein